MEVAPQRHALKKNLTLFLIALLLLTFLANNAYAQEQSELSLRLSRDFGYSSGTGKIQGTFSMKAYGPENLTRVVFLIDEQPIGESTQAPFRLRFNTDNYNVGNHTLSAIGYTADGSELQSNEIRAEFVSFEEGWQDALRIVGPLFAIIFGVIVLSFLFSFISIGKHKRLALGAERKYGAAGGTICPKCKRPFSINFFAPNILVGKFDRCPFCGKWSVVRSLPSEELRAAEAAELESAQGDSQLPDLNEADQLRKELEDSRFQDL